MKKTLILFILLSCFWSYGQTSVPGCTDPQAVNYNPLATIDDGSCCIIDTISQLGSKIIGDYENAKTGRSVSVSADGNTVAIGAPEEYGNYPIINNLNLSGAVRVYHFDGLVWNQIGQTIDGVASNCNSGWSVSLSAAGNYLAIGAPGCSSYGYVRIYEYNGYTWLLKNDILGEVNGGNVSGSAVSLSDDANIVAIGDYLNDGVNGNDAGHVRVYSSWGNQMGSDIDGEAAGDYSGWSVSLSADGNILAVGSKNAAGYVKIYEWQLITSGPSQVWDWVQLGQNITENGSLFGYSVSLSDDGHTVAIGAPHAPSGGHVKIYNWNGSSWVQLGQNITGVGHVGRSVSLSADGNTVAIGSAEQILGGSPGPAYVGVYTYNGFWIQLQQNITGSNSTFGYSVSLSADGETIAIGSPMDNPTNTTYNWYKTGSASIYRFGNFCAGCTDPLALNFSSLSWYNDGSCVYPSGCTDALAINYDSIAIVDDSSCIYPIFGCTDPSSQQYDPLANTDDGSCTSYIIETVGMSFSPDTIICTVGDTITFNLGWNHNAVEVSLGTYLSNTTTPNGGFNFSYGTIGIFTPLNVQTYYYICQPHVASGMKGVIIANPIPVFGCTNAASCNYNPSANVDDGSCLYGTTGCMDPIAFNYDSLAVCDDGSCGYCFDPRPITGINLTDIIHDRVVFNWDDMNSTCAAVDQIRFRYREVGTSSYSTKTMGSPVGNNAPCLNTFKRVLNLTSSTQYEYEFKIWYQDGIFENWHAYGIFTTAPQCDNVINMIATPVNTTKTTFCWDTISMYSFVRMRMREDLPGSLFSNIGGFGVYSPLTCKTKNGLTPGTQYRVSWRTWCTPIGGPYRSPQWDGPVLWTQPTSIRVDELSSISSLEVYPNPSRDVFNVSFTSYSKQSIEIRVVNLIGEVIFTKNLEDFEGEYTHSFNLSEYSKGIYLLELDTDNGIVNKKLILQ